MITEGSLISFSTKSAHQIIFRKETFQTNNWPLMVKMNLGLWLCWNLAELEIAIAERKLREIVKKENKLCYYMPAYLTVEFCINKSEIVLHQKTNSIIDWRIVWKMIVFVITFSYFFFSRFICISLHCPKTKFPTSIRRVKSTESSNYCTNYHHMIMKSGNYSLLLLFDLLLLQ